jgi:hypothetical protein
MMSGKMREYNWRDIKRLIFADAGVKSDEDARMLGDMWYVGGFREPDHERDTCIRLIVYDKPYGERLEEHAGE